jgi:ARG/rhodanese/phosphatase superfamily protein
MTTLALAVFAGVLAGVPPAPAAAPKISGPYRHENLDIYLVHGRSTLGDRKLLTLGQALDQKKVVVRETQNVSQLTVENVSNEEVYIQAGDIVKGGQQDRALSVDLVLPPKSGRVAIGSFCVEQGRWRARGQEAADRFASSNNNLAHKDLKIANYAGSQTSVWSNVAKVQEQLASHTGGAVRHRESPSSLQLTLENDRVRTGVEQHVKALAGVVDKNPDAIGYAFAVNGVLSSADVYASSELFRALWPKLLEASAIEAVAEGAAAKPAPSPTVDDVQGLLAESQEGTVTEKNADSGTRTKVRDTPTRVLVEAEETADGKGWIRRGYIKK